MPEQGAPGAAGGSASSLGEVASLLELDEAWLVDPASGREGPGSLVVVDGVIASVEWDDEESLEDESLETAHAIVVTPSFIDLHAHVREPGDEEAETFATALDAAAHGGFGWILTMADTRPSADRPEVVQRIRAAAAASGSPVSARPYGAVTIGREGSGLAPLASLASAGVVGFSDDPAPFGDAALLRAALTEAGALGLPVVVHADEPSLTAGAEANEGLPATILGLRGAPAAAESSAVSRAVSVLRQVSLESPPDVRPHLHIAHLSVAEALEPIRAARAEGLRITADVTPHHLALHDGWVGGDRRYSWEAAGRPYAGGPATAPPYASSTRIDPPLRSPEDALALLAGLQDGTIDAIATDHAPWRQVDKDVPFGEARPGMSGLETCLGLVLEAVAAGRLSLPRAMRALSLGPWRAIDGTRHGIPEPVLREGSPANLVVFDRLERWRVASGPGGALRSRAAESPLAGLDLPGRVLLTVARGRICWNEASDGASTDDDGGEAEVTRATEAVVRG